MSRLKIQGKELRQIGFPEGPVISVAMRTMEKHHRFMPKAAAMSLLQQVLTSPAAYLDDEVLGKIARFLVPASDNTHPPEIPLSSASIPYAAFGISSLEAGAIQQMDMAMRLPVSVAGALMADAHQGYGLPIGGVLATENAVIPYGVGVDIGCRMCLSIFDYPGNQLTSESRRFKNVLLENTLFGAGKEFATMADHEIIERRAFDEIPLLKNWRGRAARQLGTSGSGNHFAEFGVIDVKMPNNTLGLPEGPYIALLTHSGSRGLGAAIARHYTTIAMNKTRLPKLAKHLAWLPLDTQEGIEYWNAMQLAGDYASACHQIIHDKVAKALRTKPLKIVENHHNFAWKEHHHGRELIVHRKGATPAGKGVLGIIPGSMTDPGYIVLGKGDDASLASASHGAGRRMSRTEAARSITRHQLNDLLTSHGVELIGGGLDEAPPAYKDIREVMRAQDHLVEIIATFQPRIVRMDD